MILSNELKILRKEWIHVMKDVFGTIEKDILDEAAFPAYLNKNPVIIAIFWGRIYYVMKELDRLICGFDRALDFGTGSGIMLPFLAKRFLKISAVDKNLEPVREIISRLEIENDKILFSENIENISNEKPRALFDAIVCLDVLEHILDYENVLIKLSTLLTEKGRIIISGPTENFFYQVGRRLAGKEYDGHYHFVNIYDISKKMESIYSIEKVINIPPVTTLFQIIIGKKKIRLSQKTE